MAEAMIFASNSSTLPPSVTSRLRRAWALVTSSDRVTSFCTVAMLAIPAAMPEIFPIKPSALEPAFWKLSAILSSSVLAPTNWERAAANWAELIDCPEARCICSNASSVVVSAPEIFLNTDVMPSLSTICDLIVATVSPPFQKS